MSYWTTFRSMIVGAVVGLLPTISMAHDLGEPIGPKAPVLLGASGSWIALKEEGLREHSKRCLLIGMLSSPTAQKITAFTLETETGSGLDDMSVSLQGPKDAALTHTPSLPIHMRLHTAHKVDLTYAFPGNQVSGRVGPFVEASISPSARPSLVQMLRSIRYADSASISISDMPPLPIPIPGFGFTLDHFVSCNGLDLYPYHDLAPNATHP